MLRRRQELKGKQRLAFMLAKDWIDDVADAIDRDGHARDVAPLRLLIKGTAGTGKSFVIERINEYVSEVAKERGWRNPDKAAAVAAYTGVAAFNVRGRTLHSLFGLPTKKEDFDDVDGARLEKLQGKLADTKLLILDERSMIGRRTLSWLSCRAQQGLRNRDVSFGGLGVIQLGDDAQLPPIGDFPLYTRHVRKTANFDSHTVAGVGLVDEFVPPNMNARSAVVVLDVLHRQKGTDSVTRRFKRALTHLRDGCWGGTKEASDKALCRDYALFRTRRLHYLTRAEQDRFRTGLRLYATNDKVNQYNREHLRKLRKRCTIHAVNKGEGASDAPADQAGGLQRKVYLGINARVMLTSNVWTEKGLVNGAIGVVKAICFEGDQVPPAMPACVIVQFPQYEGPSFEPDRYGPHCVPITPLESSWSQKAKGGFAWCSRTQLPLKLAWAITIHKSQGLTIGQHSPTAETVVIDIGDKEMCAGLTFVALSRAKRLEDIAFAFPMFGWRRLSRCGEGTHLATRKEFEARLDRAGELTAERYAFNWPYGEPPDAAADEEQGDDDEHEDDDDPIDEELLAAVTPNCKQNAWVLSKAQSAHRQSLGSPEPPTAKKQKTTTRQVSAASAIATERYNSNRAVINATHPYPTAHPPARRPGWTMRMRIVDFLRDDATKFTIANWARRVGFEEVAIDRVGVQQPSCECGYIAAIVMASLKRRADWLTLDIDTAATGISPVDDHWVNEGNRLLQLPQRVWWLGDSQILKLAACWDPDNTSGDAIVTDFDTDLSPLDGWGHLPWMKVGSLDETLRYISEILQNDEVVPNTSPALFVCNTEDSRSGGYHWISIALSAERDN